MARTADPPLPPWSGNDEMCPKCGSGLNATWHRISLRTGFPCLHVKPPRHFEHMCRMCPCCGYGRIEATLDAGQDEGPADG